jgi:predicted transcriptional regulator
MSEVTNDDLADTLDGRYRFLRALAAEPSSKRALEDRLSVSRSTVDRAIRDLQSKSLVAYEDRTYHLTVTGRYGLSVHETATDRLEALAEMSDDLSRLDDGTPLEAAFLVDAEVIRPSPRTPDAIVSRLFRSVRRADHVDGIAPVALMGHLTPFYSEATEDGGTMRMLLDAELFDDLVTDDDEPLRRGIDDPDVSLERATVPFGFGLWISKDGDDDAEAGVVIYSETGVKAVVVNDDSAALSWAREQFERVAETAVSFEEATATLTERR